MTNDSLLSLFGAWRDGATILAGTGVPAVEPVPTGNRVVRICEECPTWCIGADQAEAVHRLTTHRRHCHPPRF